MKKYLPVLLFTLFFSGALALQIGLDFFDTVAGISNIEKKEIKHYNSLLNSTVFQSTEGKQIVLNEISSEIIIINFWASWCIPCIAELKSLVELKRRFPATSILSINVDEEGREREVSRVVEQYNFPFDLVLDTSGFISNDFFVEKVPTTIIYKNKKVVKKIESAIDFLSAPLVALINVN